MRIAGFRDRTAFHPVSAGVLAGHQPAVTHRLTGLEPREAADFGNNRSGRKLSYSTQRLQRLDHGPELFRRFADRFVDFSSRPTRAAACSTSWN
jgi:hypothetical protein